MDSFHFFNGKLLMGESKLVGARNRGLRYGDGLFETMKVVNAKVVLESFHFDRLFHGLQTLQFDLPAFFTREYLSEAILKLCFQNHMEDLARVRLNVFRGDGSPFSLDEKDPCIIIETEKLPAAYGEYNEKGYTIDIYRDVRKSCDILSNLKSNNYLHYIMTANHARTNGLDDCLVLNSYERICDSSVANVFWVTNKQVFTPPLSEGCVSGIMRRFLVEKMQQGGYAIEEMICTKQRLKEADEIFLTNALFGIRWVEKLQESTYTNKISTQLYKQFVNTLFSS